MGWIECHGGDHSKQSIFLAFFYCCGSVILPNGSEHDITEEWGLLGCLGCLFIVIMIYHGISPPSLLVLRSSIRLNRGRTGWCAGLPHFGTSKWMRHQKSSPPWPRTSPDECFGCRGDKMIGCRCYLFKHEVPWWSHVISMYLLE